MIVKPDPFLVAKTEFQCFNKIIDLCGTPNEGLNYIFSFMMIGLMFSNCPITTIL
jgi:cyclin-dependent kinase 3/cyclin-dependent kinase 12/13